MRKWICLFLFNSFFGMMANATDGEYAVLKIPPALLKNANAVVRLHEQYIDLQKEDRMSVREHYVITILNEEGNRFAGMYEPYDKFKEIKSIEGNLYDAFGKKLKSLKNKDIEDGSGSGGESLADDNRYKQHDFSNRVYPYTVEYIVEYVKKETMFFIPWVPVFNELVSVEKSVFAMEVPATYQLRHKDFNYNSQPEIQEKGGNKIYTWALSNFEAIKKEYAAPSWKHIAPFILFAPSTFVIEDYKGNMDDWSGFGKFILSLNKGRDQLPEPVKAKVAELVQGASTTEEKVIRLYRYLQANTRYISIQLGIGGWRPLEASFVANKLYGDCKALSNYMYALLKEAGINSCYTVIQSGDGADDIQTDFSSSQFNHVILSVPMPSDTLWLECTSQTQPPGYMGGFTGNRHAVMITEEGGKLVTTPHYGMNENTQHRKVKAVLNEDATLDIKATTTYSCMQQDDLHMMIHALSKDKVKEYLQGKLDLATYEVGRFNYKEQPSRFPSIEEELDITASNYATITGKRLFIMPNVMSRHVRRLTPNESRKYDVELDMEYRDTDSVEIVIPAGYTPESVPQEVVLETKFGRYRCTVKVDGNRILYYRMLEHFAGRFPAKDYAELVKFYDAMYKADRAKMVLVKNETTPKSF